MGIGVINALGIYALNKAIKINLSRTMANNHMSILFSIVLSVLFLGESQYLDVNSIFGILILVSIVMAAISVVFIKGFGNGEVNSKWYVYLILFAIFNGLSSFLIKATTGNIRSIEILLFQHIGSIITISFMMLMTKQSLKISRKNVNLSMLSGLFLLIALSLMYLSLAQAPLMMVKTFQMVGLSVGGVIMGLILFEERKHFEKKSIIGLSFGFISIFLLICGRLGLAFV
jgi:hypothetical protein